MTSDVRNRAAYDQTINHNPHHIFTLDDSESETEDQMLSLSPADIIVHPVQQNADADPTCSWNCRDVCLGFFGAVALAASAVAIALLFTPVGAGAVAMGLLIGGAVVLAATGVALLVTLIFQSSVPKTAKEYLKSLPNAPYESQKEDIERFATSILPQCVQHLNSTDGIFREPADIKLIDTMRNKRLPADGSFPLKLFDPHLIAGYLKSLFREHKIARTQDFETPIVPFTGGGLSEVTWCGLNENAIKPDHKGAIIRYLQSDIMFENSPTCVIYYILLLHEIAKNPSITRMTTENLAKAALNPLILQTFTCHNIENNKKTALAEFIIRNAPEIFPKKAVDFYAPSKNLLEAEFREFSEF